MPVKDCLREHRHFIDKISHLFEPLAGVE
jgi:hypothetical protein